MQPQMKLNPDNLAQQAKNRNLRDHYLEALKSSYWPGLNGDKFPLLASMPQIEAVSAIRAIQRDEVEALTLNPELKFDWLDELKLIARGETE